MEINVTEVVIGILTTLITGGFIIILVEIGNRRNREYDNFRYVVKPFLEKLSAYCRFVFWYSGVMKYSNDKFGSAEEFKNRVEFIRKKGSQLNMFGGDFSVNYFSSKELYDLIKKINDLWFQYFKMKPYVKFTIDEDYFAIQKEVIEKELASINTLYLSRITDESLLIDVSTYMYSDLYRPIADEFVLHELKERLYKTQTLTVLFFVFLIVAFLILLLCFNVCLWLPILILIISMVLLLIGIMFLCIKEEIQLKLIAKFYNRKNKY